MLNRTDVERIVETMLRDITIEVKTVSEDPNYRKIELLYNNKMFSESYFDIKES